MSWIIGGSKFFTPLFKLQSNLNRYVKFFTGTCWVCATHSHGALAKIRFGEKTYAMLQSALEYYPLEVIKEYIKMGASNNAVWETKDDSQIDTNEFVDEVAENLTEGEN